MSRGSELSSIPLPDTQCLPHRKLKREVMLSLIIYLAQAIAFHHVVSGAFQAVQGHPVSINQFPHYCAGNGAPILDPSITR